MWPEHTAFERVHLAVEQLAYSAAPLQTRLDVAGLTLLPLLDSDFRAGEERQLYQRIMKTLTGSAMPLGDEGTLRASTRSLDDQAAEAVAHEIVEL